ncbi:MAG: HNH endonuclease signature motif containing protein [bacterium]|nr:HNH endonuclease signature motif containing protein [bacterium]
MPIVKCKRCNQELYVKPSHLKMGYGKYCSVKCRIESSRKGKYVHCEICGKEVWRIPKDLKGSKSGKFFCNKSCQTKWRNEYFSGPNHYLWKGGEFIYRQKMLKSGARQVCQKCGIVDKRILIVHHIDHNRRNNDLSNLMWLCMNCHYLIHHYE